MNKRASFTYRYRVFICCFVLAVCACCPAWAQNVDSLRTVINNYKHDDTTRANLLIQFGLLYQDANPDSTIIAATEGLAISEKTNFDKGHARCNHLLGLAWFRKNQFEKALGYYQQALRWHGKTANYTGQASANLSMADIFYRQGKYSLAIDYYNRGIEIADQHNIFQSVGLGLISIGGIYSDLGSYSEALKYYLKALDVFEKNNNPQGLSMTYTNMATIYSRMGDYPRAVDYINRSTSIPSIDRETLLFNLTNAGTVYLQMKDFKSALTVFNNALLLADTIGDDSWKNVGLNDVAEAYYNLGEYDSAFVRYAAVLKKATEVNDPQMLLASHAGLGKVYLKKGRSKEAIAEITQAVNLAKESGMKEAIMTNAMELSKAYERTHDYSHAMTYRDIYYQFRDSVYNDNTDKRIRQLQFDYELDKKQKEIESSRIAEQARKERNKIIIFSLVAVCILFVIIIFLLYRSRLYERRNNENMVKQKEEIQRQAIKLERLNRFKDKTFSVLSHDLRGPVNTFSAAVMLLNERQITMEEFEKIKPEIGRQIGSLSLLLDNVLGWAKNHMNEEIVSRPSKTNIYHLAYQNTITLQATADRKAITLTNNISETTYAMCDAGQIDIVLRNLIMNSIKYTGRSGTVTLTASTADDTVQMMITDNGIGMSAAQIETLFVARQDNKYTYGTDGEKGIGLGLILCYDFVKANNGAITVTSQPGKGSTFTVTLPRYKSPL